MSQVSVIVPCFNSAAFVGATLRSVIAQTSGDWECIVVDDGSTDGSADIVGVLAANEPRIRLIRQANRGVCAARNAGFRAASPDTAYVIFLDADDCLEPDALDVMTRYLDQHSHVGVVHSEPSFIDANGRAMDIHPSEVGWKPRFAPCRFGVRELPPHEPETPFASVYNLASIIPSGSLIRRSVFEQTPGFDESFGQHFEDSDLFFHLAIRSLFHFLPQKLVRHRRHPGQNTADPSRFGRQEEKLFAKWHAMDGLTVHQRDLIDAARRFRAGPMALYSGLRSGRERMRSGQFLYAARFYIGAVRRYIAWFISASLFSPARPAGRVVTR